MLLSQSGYSPSLSFTSFTSQKKKVLCVQLTGETRCTIYWQEGQKLGNTTIHRFMWQTMTAEKQTTQMRVNTPARAWVMSSMVGCGLFLSRAYVDITIPGVQKPHWEPWALAIRSWKDIITTNLTVYLVFVVVFSPHLVYSLFACK